MAVIVKQCEVFLFDVHIYLAPLVMPGLFKEGISFLASAAVFNEAYGKGQSIEGFPLRPFTNHELETNHFWHYFGGSLEPQRETPWERQLPFIMDTGLSDISFQFNDLDAEAKAHVLVWPWGWSSNLHVTLTGELEAPTLRDIVARQSANTAPGTFLFEGKARNCNAIFEALAERIQDGLYRDGTGVSSAMPVARHFVLSIQEVKGEPRPYRRRQSLQPLSDRERAELHSILLGAPVDLKQLAFREKAEPRRFLLTDFSGPTAFGLTDFDRGTVLYIHDLIARGERKGTASQHCFTANIRSSALTSLALASLLKEIETTNSQEQALQGLATSARKLLTRLTIAPHKFHGAFVKNNSQVAKFL